jgi:chemosensory pili system protein ChpA (sensor histidine kinase/response regulator)
LKSSRQSPAYPAPRHRKPKADAAAQRANLRVRADLIDRLVNEAGELSIARLRIEGEMRGIKARCST